MLILKQTLKTSYIIHHSCNNGYPDSVLQGSLDKVQTIRRSDLFARCALLHTTSQKTPIKDILKIELAYPLINPKLQCVLTHVFGHMRRIVTPLISTKVCNNNFRYCPKLDHSGLLHSTTTGWTFIIPFQITCKLNNLVYLITCNTCKSQYVG